MFAELVELGKRVRKVHDDALREEKCSWDIVIDKEGNFLNLIPCDITIEAENLTAKNGKARLLLDKQEETLGFNKDKHEKYLEKLSEYKDIQELSPVFAFYNKPEEVERARKEFAKLQKSERKGNLTFMVDSERLLSNENVKNAIGLYEMSQIIFRKSNKKSCPDLETAQLFHHFALYTQVEVTANVGVHTLLHCCSINHLYQTMSQCFVGIHCLTQDSGTYFGLQ